MKIGYYVFFGNGDYHAPSQCDSSWIATWNMQDWVRFIFELKSLDVNTLFIYLNGHKLPFNSKRHPELVDQNHKNVKTEFLIRLLEYIRSQGISVTAVITTTGHAGEYSIHQPDACIVPSKNIEVMEQDLIAFPQHLRKGKTASRSGAAQLGFGVLCHHHPKSQQYAVDMIEEIIENYGRYLDGIALHPPETLTPCVCDKCCETYSIETGKDLRVADLQTARKFFILSYLKFQSEKLFPTVTNKLGINKTNYVFTIPWLFESVYSEAIKFIPKHISIIDWDYNLDATRISALRNRLQMYQSSGHQLIFMPTGGFSFDQKESIDLQIESVHTQLAIAIAANVDGIIHFLGPRISPYFINISVSRMLEQASVSYARSKL